MKIKKNLFTILFLSFVYLTGCTRQNEIISIWFDDDLLRTAKQAVIEKDSLIMPLYTKFISYVDSVSMRMEPLNVVRNKGRIAPSKDPRDYISLSPYWWPDTTVEGGEPYIRRDGERNPEVYEYTDRVNSTLFADNIQLLAVAYYLSGQEKYALKTAEMLKSWFLDPETGMNPNMTYSQTVPGMKEIRGTGIIDARRIVAGLNAAKMIEGSQHWSDQNKADLKDWADAFRYWLEHSVNGLKEQDASNNHGLWYEVTRQAVIFYTEDYEGLKKTVEKNLLPRIDSQMKPDGSLPEELARTLGLHYSTFVMEALSTSDIIAGKVGINLWDYKTEDGRSMSTAVEFLKPYWQEPEKWPYMQISPFNKERGALMLYRAGRRTGKNEYTNLARKIGYYPDTDNKDNSDSMPFINGLLYTMLARDN